MFSGKYLYTPSEQQFDELLYGGQTASKSQTLVFVMDWFSKTVNSCVIIRFFQFNGFLQVVSFSNVLGSVRSMDCNFINANIKQSD